MIPAVFFEKQKSTTLSSPTAAIPRRGTSIKSAFSITTFSITTFDITTFDITTFDITTFDITTFDITTFDIVMLLIIAFIIEKAGYVEQMLHLFLASYGAFFYKDLFARKWIHACAVHHGGTC